MKTLMAIGALALFSGFALADTILENGGAPTFSSMPSENGAGVVTGVNSGIPYGANFSSDITGTGNACGGSTGNCADIFDFLTATGSFTGGTNYNPNQYLSSTTGTTSFQPNDAPPAFNLVHTTNSLLISLLGTYTGSTMDMFGLYDASQTTIAGATASESGTLLTNGSTLNSPVNESGFGATNYGFYVKNATNTWFSNTALDATDGTHQHFIIFTTPSDPNTFYVGVTDWFYNNGNEKYGDFQDLVIKVNADAAVPEPATFALMGAGLLGLGYARFRSRKNRA
jgi:hypothetical protein